jgi:hypothetical protein
MNIEPSKKSFCEDTTACVHHSNVAAYTNTEQAHRFCCSAGSVVAYLHPIVIPNVSRSQQEEDYRP